MMIFWQDTHRRFRDQLSSYLDGQLDPAGTERLEEHLSGCRPCRTELAQLRATAATLNSMPQAEAPRSFALSAEHVGARRPPRQAVPLAFGLRLATAAVAVAFAAVLVADLGDSGGDSGGVTPTSEQPARRETQSYADEDVNAPADSAGGVPTVSPTAEAQRTPAAALAPEDASRGDETPSGEAAPPNADGESRNARAPSAGDGGGVDALRAAEIALGVTLALLLLGGGAMAYAGRKR